MREIKIIYNPSSGLQVQQDKIFVISQRLLESENIRISLFATKKQHDAYQEALFSCRKGCDLIIACGGDGTVNEVINGMMASGSPVPLAILAAGSVNDFSEHLNLPTDISKFCDMILQNKTQAVDIGQANDTYFINVVAGGAFTNIAHEVPSDTKTILGKFAYYLQGAIELPYQLDKTFPLQITIDQNDPISVDAFLFLIANSPSVGGFKNLVSEADVSDGWLDLLVVKKSTKKDLLETLSKVVTGQPVKNDSIIYKKVRSLAVSSPPNQVELDIDGERGQFTPAVFRIIPGAITLVVP